MFKICPECKCYSVEFDPHQMVERCLNNECGWINRDRIPLPEQEARSYKFSRVMEKRVRSNLKTGHKGHTIKEEVGT